MRGRQYIARLYVLCRVGQLGAVRPRRLSTQALSSRSEDARRWPALARDDFAGLALSTARDDRPAPILLCTDTVLGLTGKRKSTASAATSLLVRTPLVSRRGARLCGGREASDRFSPSWRAGSIVVAGRRIVAVEARIAACRPSRARLVATVSPVLRSSVLGISFTLHLLNLKAARGQVPNGDQDLPFVARSFDTRSSYERGRVKAVARR
eukprot:scaffold125672_cov34-Tisochrysis_lutea.AAC.2